MVRPLTYALMLLAALVLSGCTVVLPLAEQALTPATVNVPTTANTAARTIVARTPVATATAPPTPGYYEPDLRALDLPNEQLQALGEALLERGLVDADWLAGIVKDGPLTLLAPSDTAFAALDPASLESMLGDREALERFVGAHVIRGMVSLDDLLSMPLVTVSGGEIKAIAGNGGFLIEGRRVLQHDVVMPFGVLHVIDGILPGSGLEPEATSTPVPTPSPTASATATATVRPTEQATRTATATPEPTATAVATATLAARPTPAPVADLMSTVENTPGLSRVAELLQLAGLDNSLSQAAGMTFLAPTDDAFAELSDEEYAWLTGDSERLLAWLERHLIPVTLTAAELARMATVPSLSGEVLAIRNRLGRLIIDGARVLERDIPATNGTIHTVDTVVFP